MTMNLVAAKEKDKNELVRKKRFGLLIGVIYEIFAILQAIVSTGIVDIVFIPAMPIGVLVLGVIGAVFLYGYWELEQGIEEGVSYIHVGIIISLIFGIIYLLIMGAHSLQSYLIGSEDYESWEITDDLRPELYLAILTLIGYLLWKDDFSDIQSPGKEVPTEPIALVSDLDDPSHEHGSAVTDQTRGILNNQRSTGGKDP